MSELRKKQKRKREDAIIQAAIELIDKNGYRNTSIEEIAQMAEVGPATVYNYFGSKAGLFLSVVGKIGDLCLEKSSEIMEDLPSQPSDAIFELIEIYLGDIGRLYSRHLFREMVVAVMVEQLSVRKEVMRLDYVLMEQISDIIIHFQEAGTISRETNPEDAAYVIYSLLITDIMAYLMNDDISIDECFVMMKHHIELAFKGIS